jgi:hypothetical protein
MDLVCPRCGFVVEKNHPDDNWICTNGRCENSEIPLDTVDYKPEKYSDLLDKFILDSFNKISKIHK